MMVSERAPSATLVSPAPISPFAPMRLSTPMMRKFSSPFWAPGSRMSLELGSSATMVLSNLFLALCHCQAAPVTAKADTAMSTAADRAASSAGRRLRTGCGCGALPAAGFRLATNGRRARANAARSGNSSAGGAMEIGTVTAASSGACVSALRRVTGATRLLPVSLAIRSATAMPSVWFPVDSGEETSSCWPGVAFSPSLMFQEASGSDGVSPARQCATQPRCWSVRHPGWDRRSTTRCPCY